MFLRTLNNVIQEILGRKTLILGKMGSGKTKITAEILDKLLEKIPPDDITVIDMSPTTVPGVGGRISSYTSKVFKVRYLIPQIIRAPRIEGKSKEGVLSLAEFNRTVIEPLIQEFLMKLTPILLINDLSIYLHSGDVSKIIKCLELSNTVVANSYYNESLMDDKGSGISEKEKKLVDMLMSRFNCVLRLD